MKSRLLTTCLLTIVCLIMASCGSLEQGNPAASSALFTPRVTGMWKTSPGDPTPIGSWGNPKSELAPFPNPSISDMWIVFDAPFDTTDVSVWVVKALGPFEEESRFSSSGGANVYVAGVSSVTIMFDGTLPKGLHSINLNFSFLTGGLYTVFLSVEGTLQLADVLYAPTYQDIPVYLRDFAGVP